MDLSNLAKVGVKIAEYAAISEAAAQGIRALLRIFQQLSDNEVSADDIDREIAKTDDWIKTANEKDEQRLSGGA